MSAYSPSSSSISSLPLYPSSSSSSFLCHYLFSSPTFLQASSSSALLLFFLSIPIFIFFFSSFHLLLYIVYHLLTFYTKQLDLLNTPGSALLKDTCCPPRNRTTNLRFFLLYSCIVPKLLWISGLIPFALTAAAPLLGGQILLLEILCLAQQFTIFFITPTSSLLFRPDPLKRVTLTLDLWRNSWLSDVPSWVNKLRLHPSEASLLWTHFHKWH